MKTFSHSLSAEHHARRSALKAGAISATGALPVLSACSSSSDSTSVGAGDNSGNENSDTPQIDGLKIGLTIAQSGAFSDEGIDQLRGAELAVQHLNQSGGMVATMQPSSLQGNGVLGKPVSLVSADTKTQSDVAESAARDLISTQSCSVLVGGSSSGSALAIAPVAEELGAIYMSGMAHGNELTGDNRSAHAFRQYMNAQISSVALAETMVADLGPDRSAYYLTADYVWGSTTGESIKQATEQLGWSTVDSVATPVGAGDFSSYLTGFIQSDADVLILVVYGKDMVNAITQARELGIPDLQVNGNSVATAIPVYSTLMAEAAGENCAGVYGTINWHWSLQDEASLAFVSAYEAEYGQKPSEAAHAVYVQILQYADAVERAGSLLACDVIAELEGHTFSGAGNGESVFRATDHQCFKNTLVAVGRSAPADISDILEIRNTVDKANTEYPDTTFAGTLGSCNNG